jgi:peptidoglycan biosynthesis protein MviN/MurJ (putative lipid II flippase)
MYLLAPGFSDDRVKFDLAVRLTQITFPYLLCMSLVALLSGILNTFHRFVESSIRYLRLAYFWASLLAIATMPPAGLSRPSL